MPPSTTAASGVSSTSARRLKSLHSIVDSLPAARPLRLPPQVQRLRHPQTQPNDDGALRLAAGPCDAKHSKAVAESISVRRRNWPKSRIGRTSGPGPDGGPCDKATATPQRVLGYLIKSSLGNTYRYDAPTTKWLALLPFSMGPGQTADIPDDSPLGRLVSSIPVTGCTSVVHLRTVCVAICGSKGSDRPAAEGIRDLGLNPKTRVLLSRFLSTCGNHGGAHPVRKDQVF